MKNSENNKKRVLLCTGSFNTGAGGVASYAHDFIDAFNAEYQFAVITGDNYENASENMRLQLSVPITIVRKMRLCC